MGSVFSPYYRRHWQRGTAAAEDHCAINVCLYSPGQGRWAMTERGRRGLSRSRDVFSLGPSALRWEGDELHITLDEVANPLPRRVRGRVRVRPAGLSTFVAALDDGGRHRWGSIAPCARVEGDFDEPGLRWAGHGYLDSNEGDEPVSEPFSTWDWLRAPLTDGSTVVVYDVRQSQGRADRVIATRFWPDGRQAPVEPPPRQALPASRWRVPRTVRSESGETRVLRTLEDTPFYARSVVQARLCGEPVVAMHETLSATRFASPWVQLMLPFRMPRRA